MKDAIPDHLANNAKEGNTGENGENKFGNSKVFSSNFKRNSKKADNRTFDESMNPDKKNVNFQRSHGSV